MLSASSPNKDIPMKIYHPKITQFALLLCYSALLPACHQEAPSESASSSAIIVPSSFPALNYPADNVPTAAKIELGRHLFYDHKLSGNQTYSCATCHQQRFAFTDGKGLAIGSTEEKHSLGSMSLSNVGYSATLGWGNPMLSSLEAQGLIPMFGEDPIELGLNSLSEEEILARFTADASYREMFDEAFPQEKQPITIGNLMKALASFERSLISADSPYDRFIAGDQEALTAQEKRGMDLFFSEKMECFHCHGGFNFSDSVASPDFPFYEKPFHNNGMYNIGGTGRYLGNQGVFEHTRKEEDLGRFKAPTLRNIEVTGPYLHDGSVETLDELIELYANGGRVINEGESAGDGTVHPNKSAFVAGFDLTEDEKLDLIAFLHALTDETFLNDPHFSDPFAEE